MRTLHPGGLHGLFRWSWLFVHCSRFLKLGLVRQRRLLLTKMQTQVKLLNKSQNRLPGFLRESTNSKVERLIHTKSR